MHYHHRRREHALTVAMYFHCFAFVSAGLPLAAGYPEPAVLPSPLQAAMLLLIACGSFGGNLLVNRAFQLELAAKASAVNFTQVGGSAWGGWGGGQTRGWRWAGCRQGGYPLSFANAGLPLSGR